MAGIFQSFIDKWNNWCGDHDMENAIRAHLTSNGYFGSSVQFRNVRLVAVQRPGWLQLYRFEATARVQQEESEGPEPEPVYEHLFGLVREDQRKNESTIRVFKRPSERRELFLRWSDGLIQLRGAHGLV